jgi:DNA-binding CsgD family transcriptional regulator
VADVSSGSRKFPRTGGWVVWTFEDYVEQSQKASTTLELKTLIGRVLAEEGYENYLMTSIAEGDLGHVVWSEFPPGFLATYFAERWDSIDPLISFALKARRPFLWGDVATSARLSRAQADFMQQIRRMGVHSGIVFPMHRTGRRRDAISISMRHGGDQDPGRIGVLQAVCAQTWSRYSELADGLFDDDTDTLGLTGQQLEILNWIKCGKSNADIGEVLNISSKTIEYHIGKILDKLKASSRITAVVVALRRGLITL